MKLKDSQAFLLFQAARPRQWVKNLAIFAALIFNGLLFNSQYLILSLKSFLVFCLLASSAYIINDLSDLKSDQLHPFKRLRPLASGRLDKKTAFLAAVLSFTIASIFAFLTSRGLFIMGLIFFSLQLSYTLFFKKITVIDALAIAGAYIIRAYTGVVLTGYHLSVWLMLSVVSLAIFLAIAKRRAELALLTTDGKISLAKTRASLASYKAPLLDIYLSIFATSIWITYGFYTFNENASFSESGFLKKFLPVFSTLGERKWLMVSIPFVLYGVMRYLELIYTYGQGESPEKLLFMDKNLLSTVIIWGFSIIFAIYLI